MATKKNAKAKKATVRGASAKKGPKRAVAKAKKATTKRAPAPKMRTLTPYLAVGNAAEAIAWYGKAFGAKESGERQPAPGGKVMHAELRIGDSTVFLSDIFPGSDMVDPSRAGASVNLHVWSKNVDKLWKSATQNGAKVTMPLDDMFWGDRYGRIVDPFGHSWALSYKSKLSKKELEAKRVEAMKDFPGAS